MSHGALPEPVGKKLYDRPNDRKKQQGPLYVFAHESIAYAPIQSMSNSLRNTISNHQIHAIAYVQQALHRLASLYNYIYIYADVMMEEQQRATGNPWNPRSPGNPRNARHPKNPRNPTPQQHKEFKRPRARKRCKEPKRLRMLAHRGLKIPKKSYGGISKII